MKRTIILEKHGRIAVLCLANPPINCVNYRFLQDFEQVLDEIEQSEDIEVMVIASMNPKIFATGRDERVPACRLFDKEKLLNKVLERITALSIPSISVINGTAIGAGLEIALVSDLRIASEFSKLGFYSDLHPTASGKKALTEVSGPAKTKELTWLGQLVEGQEALRIGLINRLYPESHLMTEALGMALSIFQSKRNVTNLELGQQ